MNIARNALYSLALSISALATPVAAATVDAGEIISSFGLVALNNLTASSETMVRAYVGGDLQSNGYTVNNNRIGNASIDGVSGALIVGGNVSGNDINVLDGDASVGSVTGTINVVSGNSLNTGVSVAADDVTDALQDLSIELSGMATTSGAVLNAADQNLMSIQSGTASGSDFAVLNVAEAYENFLSTGTITSVANSGTLIVNVPGETVMIQANANAGDSNVLFNFYEATNLTVNSTFDYGILAPLADLMLQGGGTNTVVVGYNVTQRTEVRGSFTGTLPSVAPVPLPASGLLLLGAIAGTTVLRRRKSKA